MEKLFSKEKNNSEYYLPAIQSFANNYKKRLKFIEYHLKREDYIFGTWKAILIPKKMEKKDLSLYLIALMIKLY